MRGRLCTECGTVIDSDSPLALTCSATCRSRRSRRLKRGNKRAKQTREDNLSETEVAFRGHVESAPSREIDDAVRDVVREELRPVVREAINEEVLRSIQRLVGLSPHMVDALADDLESSDPNLRQRAYTLGMKYTLGHPALIKPEDGDKGQQMVVVFDGMPRQGEAPVDAELVDETAKRTCNGCAEDKPLAEFVGSSDRCQSCHDALRARAEALLD